MSNQNNKILNPKTNRYINIDGKLYKSLKDVYFSNINYSLIVKNIDILYSICNLGRILIFNEKSETNNKTKTNILLFIEKFYHQPQNVIYEYLKFNSNSKKSLEQILNNYDDNINSYLTGLELLSIFIKYFLVIENLFHVNYDIPKTRLILYMKKKKLKIFDTHIVDYIEVLDFMQLKKKEFSSSLFNAHKNISNMYDYYIINAIVDPYIVTLNTVNSWYDVPLWRIICLENFYYFDFCFLIKAIYYQLNSSNYNNPQPTYPCNPFTKQNISIEKLHSIKFLWNMIHKNLNPKNNCFNVFIQNYDLWFLDSDISWKNLIISKFNESLRWRRIQNIDSQNNFQGIWVDKYEEKSDIELLIQNWLNTNNKRIYREIIKYDFYTISNSNIWNCDIDINQFNQLPQF